MHEIFSESAGEIAVRDGIARITFVGDNPNTFDRDGMTPKVRVILPVKGLLQLHSALGDLVGKLTLPPPASGPVPGPVEPAVPTAVSGRPEAPWTAPEPAAGPAQSPNFTAHGNRTGD